MINTNRISSGFDVELQLGSGWFHTALARLAEEGVLAGNIPITIGSVTITPEDDEWDLLITLNAEVPGIPTPSEARAAVTISADGTELIITTDSIFMPEKTIPFGALGDLPQPPTLVKLPGNDEHEHVMAILANMNIQAVAQSEEPRAPDDFFERGDAVAAQSFLPTGSHIVFGIGAVGYQRFANNLWHTQLRAADGTHPLPDAENRAGNWSSVSLTADGDRLKLQLEGDIPVDSPIIDLIPDPHVTIKIWLRPGLNTEGGIEFEIETEANIDTGLLGDLFVGFVGGLVGLVIGLFTGGWGFLIGFAIGAAIGVIVLEIAEAVAGLAVNGVIRARLNGQPVREILCCENGIVQAAMPNPDAESFNLGLLNTIPVSIPIHFDRPDNELFERTLLVSTSYDEEDTTVNGDGFAMAGGSLSTEVFRPLPAQITNATYDEEVLQTLEYLTDDGTVMVLTREEVLARAAEAELVAPFRVFTRPDDVTLRIPQGRLATICLHPQRIHREETIIKEIEFENGLHLKVPDAVALQDAAASVLAQFQLIHPRDYHAYYRARADDILGNNFEKLETY
jgi:hypothetical protein